LEPLEAARTATVVDPAEPPITSRTAEDDQRLLASLPPDELFLTLFAGRRDVFARGWQSKKGIRGYEPHCKNAMKPGVCGHVIEPKVRCEDCPSRELVPFDASFLRAQFDGHLRIPRDPTGESNRIGIEFWAGIYLVDDQGTCRVGVFDLDDHDGNGKPFEIGKALIAQLRMWELDFRVVRSRGGKGLHVWLFFREPVPAWKVRALMRAVR